MYIINDVLIWVFFMAIRTFFARKRNRWLAVAALLSAPLMAMSPEFTSEPWSDAAPQPRTALKLETAMLKGHNDARRAVNVAPLVWNDKLAKAATRYAAQMARSGDFEHSADTPGVAPEGENLWMGTRNAFAYGNMIGAWVDERTSYLDGTGDFEATGHYTQVIWRGTTEMGCAVSQDPNYEYLVCRYFPAGNIEDTDPLDS